MARKSRFSREYRLCLLIPPFFSISEWIVRPHVSSLEAEGAELASFIKYLLNHRKDISLT